MRQKYYEVENPGRREGEDAVVAVDDRESAGDKINKYIGFQAAR